MFWENPVRASTLEVVKKASLVKLNEKKIEELKGEIRTLRDERYQRCREVG